MPGIGTLFSARSSWAVKCAKWRLLRNSRSASRPFGPCELSCSCGINPFHVVYTIRSLTSSGHVTCLGRGEGRGRYSCSVISGRRGNAQDIGVRHMHLSNYAMIGSLGADSTGLGSTANTAKSQFEKWKANIDFDLLTESHKRIHSAHMKAVEENKETYTDPMSGFEVFTIMSHLLRGNCCGNVCRHCPYGHVNAPKEYKELMRNNTAFYY